MSEMVERVARKLEPQAWAALGTGDTLAYKNRRTSSLRKARAAIEAMREPTNAMKVAALSATFDADRGGDRVYVGDVPIIWKAMIDTALK